MLLDQLEYVAAAGDADEEMFQIQAKTVHAIVNTAEAKEFIIAFWRKFEVEGKERHFRVVPMRF
jgi:hypothetical protein